MNQVIRYKAAAIPLPKGPPVKLTGEQKRAIVEEGAQLHAAGVRIGDAQSRIAQRRGLSRRSVQRVLQQRAEIRATPFPSLADVFALFGRSEAG